MEKIASRTIAIRKSLGMNQEDFAKYIGISRGYLSHIEAELKIPSPDFEQKIATLERSRNIAKVADQSATYRGNVDPALIKMRQIAVYTFVQAGDATDYQGLPTSWDDTVGYDGPDENAFALRVSGDSMSPNFPQGTIITVSPKYPPHNGQLVVAKIKEEGVLFKIFHHSGDGKKVTLTSYNDRFYPPLELQREKLHWLYRVVGAYQKL